MIFLLYRMWNVEKRCPERSSSLPIVSFARHLIWSGTERKDKSGAGAAYRCNLRLCLIFGRGDTTPPSKPEYLYVSLLVFWGRRERRQKSFECSLGTLTLSILLGRDLALLLGNSANKQATAQEAQGKTCKQCLQATPSRDCTGERATSGT